MRKYLILLCVFILVCGTVVYARMNVGILGGSVPAGGGECTWFGSEAIDRASSASADYTVIDLNNTSPLTGNVTSIKVYTTDTITGAEFACFTDEGSNTWTTNGVVSGINLAQGLNTLTGGGVDFTSFACSTGDYVGFYVPTGGGAIDHGTGPSTGWAYVEGDLIPSSSYSFDTSQIDHELSVQFCVE